MRYQWRQQMKYIKYYKPIVLAALLTATAGCKRAGVTPYGKNVYAKVIGFSESNGIKTNYFLDLAEDEVLVLYPREKLTREYDKNLQKYNIGDTVWFHYGENAMNHGEIFSSDIIRTPSQDMKDFLIKQQNLIFNKKTR